MDPETLIERNSEMMVADMDGELVMMDVNQGNYFSVNQVGSHIWTKLETPQTVAALVTSVKDAFKTEDATQVKADVDRFLTDLETHKLIRKVMA